MQIQKCNKLHQVSFFEFTHCNRNGCLKKKEGEKQIHIQSQNNVIGLKLLLDKIN